MAVVSYNTRELLRRCLLSLHGDVAAGRAEVCVVDNGSRDGSPEMVRDEFGWAALLEPGQNLGFGRAVNLVAAQSSSPWLAPSNADVALRPGALATLAATGAGDPRAGVVAPRLVYPTGTTQHSVFAFPTLPYTLAFNLGLWRVVPGLADRMCLELGWDPTRPRRVPWALGAFLLVRRTAWAEVGGFDPAQWMYAEDLDLGWRMRRAGWRTRFEPAAVVVHDHSAAARAAFGDERTLRWQRATYAWMLRRRGLLRTRAAAWINVVGASARARLFAALARRDPNRWEALHHEFALWGQIHRAAGLAPREDLLARE